MGGAFVIRKISGSADVWRRPLSGIPFKVLLYDDLVGVVSCGHMAKIAI